jgi:hypothetical protein
MVFFNINDLKQAANKKFGRVVHSVEPVAFEYNNGNIINNTLGGVTGYLPANGSQGAGIALASIVGNMINYDKAFYGNINMSWLFDNTRLNEGPIVASHRNNSNSGTIPGAIPARCVEWQYQQNFAGAPAQAAINVNLFDIFFDEIFTNEPNPTTTVKGAGYLIHFT